MKPATGMCVMVMAVAFLASCVSEPVTIDVIKHHFEQADKDADGVLDWDELVMARKQMGHRDPAADARKVLGLWDENHDEKISLQEFLDYNRPHWRDEAESQIVTGRTESHGGFSLVKEVTKTISKTLDSANLGFLWKLSTQ
mmetsp:Transcript_6312/g.10654  ORF Transcript_6312/g.10654 Transcript_6312/m.10654 type:complete len:142 (+) Transcript_6312:122-547(+)